MTPSPTDAERKARALAEFGEAVKRLAALRYQRDWWRDLAEQLDTAKRKPPAKKKGGGEK